MAHKASHSHHMKKAAHHKEKAAHHKAQHAHHMAAAKAAKKEHHSKKRAP